MRTDNIVPMRAVNKKRMENEVVPFSALEYRLSGLPIIDNPDPVLRYLAMKGEEEYRTMERAEPAIGNAKRKRVNTLLSYGSVVQTDAKSPASQKLRDFTISAMKRIDSFHTVQKCMLDAIYWGWRPLEVLWSFDLSWQGRSYWAPQFIREKKPEQFRFTVDRDLAYIGSGFGKVVVFDRPEDQYHWLTCASGSTDNPYGDALFKSVWLIYYIKQRFMQMWAQGMARSVGVVKVGQTANPGGALLGESAKKMGEVVEELREVMKALNDKGVLIQKFGWTVDLLSDVDFSDGWKHPLAYCDEIITLAILGETLTQTIGSQGSRAAAEVHQVGLTDYCKADARDLESWINDQVIAPMLALNFGEIDPEDLPKFRSRISTAIDLEKARVLWALGAPLDGVRLAAESGVPLLLEAGEGDLQLMRPQEDPGEVEKSTESSQDTGAKGGKAKAEAEKKASVGDDVAVERVMGGFRAAWRGFVAEILRILGR